MTLQTDVIILTQEDYDDDDDDDDDNTATGLTVYPRRFLPVEYTSW